MKSNVYSVKWQAKKSLSKCWFPVVYLTMPDLTFKQPKSKSLFIIFLLITVLFAGELSATSVRKWDGLRFTPAFDQNFYRPVFMTHFPVEFQKLPELYAIIEKTGRIILAPMRGNSQPESRTVLIDFRDRVLASGSEEGLLGLAFEKNFEQTKRAYIYYSRSNPRRTVVSRLSFTSLFSPASVKKVEQVKYKVKEEIILQIKQPFSNHNGGMIAFGPDDNLYIGVGDGGSGGDPRGYAQNTFSHLGKMLRIDVSTKTGYRVPADNPFTSKHFHKMVKPEIYALGLRNPWRFSFDKTSGLLFVGDVGQNQYEEISLIQKGKNYGWNIKESFHCYKPRKNCSSKGLTDPIFEYDHAVGQSITGGYIYRGDDIKWLKGSYVFADYVQGKVWALRIDWRNPYKRVNKNRLVFLGDLPFAISSFGLDTQNELYILDYFKGRVFKMQNK